VGYLTIALSITLSKIIIIIVIITIHSEIISILVVATIAIIIKPKALNICNLKLLDKFVYCSSSIAIKSIKSKQFYNIKLIVLIKNSTF